MQWNRRGEYNPVEIAEQGECPSGCSLCYEVCPSHGNTENETDIGAKRYAGTPGIKHRSETGYYLSAYAGFSPPHRDRGASGGMATWMLERLLATGQIDAAIAVAATDSPASMFHFTVCRTVDAVRTCSRSAYYPVELSGAIRHVIRNEGRYAIIGLPCVCKAVRLAQERRRVLGKRITHVLGLACGHQCSKYFAEYVCARAGAEPNRLRGITFRTKDLSQPASNHQFQCLVEQDGRLVTKPVLWSQGIRDAFTSGCFQLQRCFHCDDIFAECADLCFMDAWLPEYVQDPRGTSLVLARTRAMDGLLRECGDLKPISVRKVVASQRSVIAEKRRRHSIGERAPVLRKRLHARFSFLQTHIGTTKRAIARHSPDLWLACGGRLDAFSDGMRDMQGRLARLSTWQRRLLLPLRITNRVARFLRLTP